ncbi:hypothetical protein [Cerasicoccus fimbriatus]|uniref:hypothetical protein n=1 Tax=Cerasicoccus fimbriatus TaxID=3014554 RepID=UPI0022B49F68|nr:hypothetical protein [Cerasicoccus sp. TK19100]
MKSHVVLFAWFFAVTLSHGQLEKYFPTDEGVVWEYDVTKTRTYVTPQGEQQDSLTGTTTESYQPNAYPELGIEGARMLQQNISQKSQLSGGESHDTLNTVFTVDGGKVLMHAQLQDGAELTEANKITPAALMIDFDKVAAGELYTTNVSMQGMSMEVSVSDYEYVTLDTALGELEDVLLVKTVGSITGAIEAAGQKMDISNGKITEQIWWAPGVGLVKQEQHMEMSLGMNGQVVVTTIEDKTKTLSAMKK